MLSKSVFLHKKSKYNSTSIKNRDKQNIIKGNKTQILQYLSNKISQQFFGLTELHPLPYYPLKQSNNHSVHIRNSSNFFSKNEQDSLQLKEIKHFIIKNLNIKKIKNINIYSQFRQLCSDSSQLIDKVQKQFVDKVFNSCNVNIINNKILLCVLLKKYKEISQNQFINRILLSLDINPANQFSTINWTIFSKLRRLMNFQETNQDLPNFLVRFFCLSDEPLRDKQFWWVIRAILGKINKEHSKVQFIDKIINYGIKKLPMETFTRDSLAKIISQYPYVWNQLAILIFV